MKRAGATTWAIPATMNSALQNNSAAKRKAGLCLLSLLFDAAAARA
jgi:hypothetical protein